MSSSIDSTWYNRLPPAYEGEFTTGARVKGVVVFIITVSIVAFVAISITAALLQYTQHVTLTQAFINLFTHMTTKQILIGSGVVATLLIGTGLVIYRARTSKDRLINSPIRLSDNYSQDLERVVYYEGTEYWGQAYIDKSTLNGAGREKAYLYAVKPCANHYVVSTVVALATPFYTAQTIVYHLLRIVPIFLYTLGCWLVERCRTNPLFEGERKFTLLDVVKQPAMSLWHVVKAPFYGLAYLSALLYSLGNPVGGRILAAKIERDWNGGKSRAEGFWSIRGGQRLWRLFDGPEKLDQFNYFLAGCYQPVGVVDYENGQIREGKSLTEAIKAGRGRIYTIFTATQLQN